MSRRSPRRTIHPLAALAAAVLALALAGCVRIDADFTIDGDTVSGTLVTALDQAAAQQYEIEPDDVFAVPTEGLHTLAGVTEAPYDDGTSVGTEYTLDRVPLDEFNGLSEQDPDGLRIIRDESTGTYQLSMVVDLVWLTDLDEDELAEQPTDPDADDVAELLERFDITIAVTFPGEVTEHNGELSGTTVTWRPAPGERAELHALARAPAAPPGAGQTRPDQPGGQADAPGASSEPDRSRAPMLALWVGLGVGALAATGLGIAWLVRRRRPAATPTEEPTPAEEPAPREAPTSAETEPPG